MVLPLVLKGLEATKWRARLNSVQLLGSMAYCAPQQLSSALPMIVPTLLGVMTDPHKTIQKAATSALGIIGSVIRNPEILQLAPLLLGALDDPTHKTDAALKALMATSFVHAVDPPSLALVIPILRRGLKSTKMSTKLMSAQVVGSICSLVGSIDDLLPYAANLLKYLKDLLVESNPEVRAVAAVALGSLYSGLGEEHMGELLGWLWNLLESATLPVQRSGAAQGLARVLRTLGSDETERKMPELLAKLSDPDSQIREGYMSLLVFLPEAFGQDFARFLDEVFPRVLQGLADEVGAVREVSVLAGQSLVNQFAQQEVDRLMPALEEGLVSKDWRIRFSSLQLMNALLLRLAGAQGKILGMQDENQEELKADLATISSKQEEERLLKIIGKKKRIEVFAAIYLMRTDVVESVRGLAWRCWKCICFNSGRALTMILKMLMGNIINGLASEDEEMETAAAESLTELVSKVGETVLAQIVPILKLELRSPDARIRRGVCLGLREVLGAARKQLLTSYLFDLVPMVRTALCDQDAGVREATGEAFKTLYTIIGKRSVEEMVPALLQQLENSANRKDRGDAKEIKKKEPKGDDEDDEDEDEESDEDGDEDEEEDDSSLPAIEGLPKQSLRVIRGLKQILDIRSAEVLPILIPALVGVEASDPFTLYHARVLALLADKFGNSFHKYVAKVIGAFIQAIRDTEDVEIAAEFRIAAQRVVLCVSTDSVHLLLDELCGSIRKTEHSGTRIACAELLAVFVKDTDAEWDPQVRLVLGAVVMLLTAEEIKTQEAGAMALAAVVNALREDQQLEQLEYVRLQLKTITLDIKGKPCMDIIPGLCLPKAVDGVLPMFQHGLMHGSAKQREAAARGMGDLVRYTTPKAFGQALVMKMTGPLIRIVGDRFPAGVKSAILETLSLLLQKCGMFLRTFVPQLQTTCFKALHDPDEEVRNNGSEALQNLVVLARRTDPIVTELANNAVPKVGVQLSERRAFLRTLVRVLSMPKVGATVSPPVMEQASEALAAAAGETEDELRHLGAEGQGVVTQYAPNVGDAVLALLPAKAGQEGGEDATAWTRREGGLLALAWAIRTTQDKMPAELLVELKDAALGQTSDDNPTVRVASAVLVGEVLLECARRGDKLGPEAKDVPKESLQILAKMVGETASGVRGKAIEQIQSVGLKSTQFLWQSTQMKKVLTALYERKDDDNGPVRRSSITALYICLRFHESREAAEQAVEAYAKSLKGATRDQFLSYIKNTVAKAKDMVGFVLDQEAKESKSL
eukprot:gb/GEZN01000432.1/.p1 GENE.gb/GEZN01000432.1/~~gb/GEZN01000432.1/.p1  ORF type:complete len:1359 (+),score=293.15 gb/GEZN01000432.1/:282-4079(+)